MCYRRCVPILEEEPMPVYTCPFCERATEDLVRHHRLSCVVVREALIEGLYRAV